MRLPSIASVGRLQWPVTAPCGSTRQTTCESAARVCPTRAVLGLGTAATQGAAAEIIE